MRLFLPCVQGRSGLCATLFALRLGVSALRSAPRILRSRFRGLGATMRSLVIKASEWRAGMAQLATGLWAASEPDPLGPIRPLSVPDGARCSFRRCLKWQLAN